MNNNYNKNNNPKSHYNYHNNSNINNSYDNNNMEDQKYGDDHYYENSNSNSVSNSASNSNSNSNNYSDDHTMFRRPAPQSNNGYNSNSNIKINTNMNSSSGNSIHRNNYSTHHSDYNINTSSTSSTHHSDYNINTSSTSVTTGNHYNSQPQQQQQPPPPTTTTTTTSLQSLPNTNSFLPPPPLAISLPLPPTVHLPEPPLSQLSQPRPTTPLVSTISTEIKSKHGINIISYSNNNDYSNMEYCQSIPATSTVVTTTDVVDINDKGININDNATTTTTNTTTTNTTINTTNQESNNNENDEISVALPHDVINITDVEWAEEPSSSSTNTNTNTTKKYPSEMAIRPKYTHPEDPCACQPSYDPTTDTFDTTTPLCNDSSCILYACQIECRSNCPAGTLCTNKRITTKQWKPVSVFQSQHKGLGLKSASKSTIHKNDFIIEYTGIAIKKEYLDSIFRRYKMERMLYIMALDNNVYIDARKKGSVARYINHSCDPNCVVYRWKVRGVSRAGIFALRDIEYGEELCFDYQWKRKRGRAPTKCYCDSVNCRGTLEDMKIDKSEEEEEEEEKLKEYWTEPLRSVGAGNEIMNRTIKIFSEVQEGGAGGISGSNGEGEEEEYFIADVCKYDPVDKKHCLIYRGEIEETWEDLDTRRWMILDEQMENFVIGRKAKVPLPMNSTINAATADHSRSSSPHPGGGGVQSAPTKVKNYVIVQTPIKEKISSKFLVDRCQRHYRVQISVSCVYASTATNEEEALEEANALNDSLDGQAWKYTFTGMNPDEARQYFEKHITDIENKSENNDDNANASSSKKAETFRHEIVIPRCVVEHVKQRLPILRNNSKTADITFTASRSKSKQFAKLIVESLDQYQASQAQIILWKEVLTLCNAHGAPKTASGLFKDLAFYGGELTQAEFKLLCPQLSEVNINHDCCENLRETADMAAFEDFFRCTVWVQAVEDVGRINSKNQLENENTGTRKIFFGCEPQRIPELWKHFELRLKEINQGVHFFNVNDHKESLLFMSKNFENKPSGMPGCFFDYLNQVTGASVRMDNFCSSSIRIDDGQPVVVNVDNEDERSPKSSVVELTEDLIKLQIDLLRDNKIRQQRWGFGRDWALIVKESELFDQDSTQLNNSGSARPGNARSLHRRYIVNSCMEISEINEALGLDIGVAAHSCIILYRYLTQIEDETLKTSQIRQRDVSLTCLFLANKCQKALKWKRLEQLLEGAYKVYYPGVKLDLKGDEARAWEKRILSTENDIMKRLDYDIFWNGTDWIVDVVTASGHMKESVVKKIMDLTLSGPVLASDSILWLKLGPEYAFTAMAALYCMDFVHLFSSLNITPLKLIDAVDSVVDSILSNRKVKLSASNAHEIFTKNREAFATDTKTITEMCQKHLSTNQYQSAQKIAGSAKQYHIIARRSVRRRVFPRVNYRHFKDNILAEVQKIREQSQCNVYFEQGSSYDTEDIVMEGTWRGLAIAEHMFRELLPNLTTFAEESNTAADFALDSGKSLYREHPGIIPLSSVSAVNGWDDISESGWKNKIGGKTCIPGKVQSKAFLDAGMRWWLHPKFIPDLQGSLCNILSVRRSFKGDLIDHKKQLSDIAKATEVENGSQFPALTALGGTANDSIKDEKQFIPVSLHRWPPEKTEAKERSKGGMGVGVSPSALQEMQLLHKLHSLIPGPNGHPNLLLPIAIAVEDDETKEEKNSGGDNRATSTSAASALSNFPFYSGRTDDILSMLDSGKNKAKKTELKGSHLLFQPTPMILQRIMSKGKKNKNDRPEAGFIPPTILTAWFHDLLSSIAHCHTNHVILRTLHPDQILIDNSGVAKMSGLTRSIVLHPNDRERYLDPISSTKLKGKKSAGITDEDIASNPYMAPELLLGANRYTQQSDIWTLASLFANLIIGKPIFSGRDRKSKLRAIFKIVGSPSSNNYKEAQSFPYYDTCKTDKKYKSGVEKALRYMFKDNTEVNADTYSCILQLLEKMLVLDPRRRLSAIDALEHPLMTDFISKSTEESFRQQFVKDWIAMREMLSNSNEEGGGSGSNTNDDDQEFGAGSSNSARDISSQFKRSYAEAMSGAISSNLAQDALGDDDDLYTDMDWKKPKRQSKE